MEEITTLNTAEQNLEILLQQFADALEMERNSNWLQGDIVAEAIKIYGKKIVGKFAEVGRCTKERINQLVRISVAFPEEYRYPELAWSFYRAVYQAAKRLEREPLDLLDEALNHEWSQADLAKLGKEKAVKAKGNYVCSSCGTKLTVEAENHYAGWRVYCPICLLKKQTILLGVLELDQKKRGDEDEDNE